MPLSIEHDLAQQGPLIRAHLATKVNYDHHRGTESIEREEGEGGEGGERKAITCGRLTLL